jgi:sulfite reductase (NADPH) flavoprotein alpha-component
MIGPGTGVAPFRAFLQERIKTNALGRHWLFFGERSRSYDFYYESYLTSLSQKGVLRLDCAFSRDQEQKIYVQHKMLENSRDLWLWLQSGALIYICGDAERMAKDVEKALIHIAQHEGVMDEDSARSYVKSLRAEKRLLLDVY